mgnify:CR=1 FL=1
MKKGNIWGKRWRNPFHTKMARNWLKLIKKRSPDMEKFGNFFSGVLTGVFSKNKYLRETLEKMEKMTIFDKFFQNDTGSTIPIRLLQWFFFILCRFFEYEFGPCPKNESCGWHLLSSHNRSITRMEDSGWLKKNIWKFLFCLFWRWILKKKIAKKK